MTIAIGPTTLAAPTAQPSRRNKVYPSASSAPKTQHITTQLNNVEPLIVEWNGVANAHGTTLSASTWATDETGVLSLSSPTISANIAQTLFTATAHGVALVRNTATFANGYTAIQWFRVKVRETRDWT